MTHEINMIALNVTFGRVMSVSPVSRKFGLALASNTLNNSGDLVPRDRP